MIEQNATLHPLIQKDHPKKHGGYESNAYPAIGAMINETNLFVSYKFPWTERKVYGVRNNFKVYSKHGPT